MSRQQHSFDCLQLNETIWLQFILRNSSSRLFVGRDGKRVVSQRCGACIRFVPFSLQLIELVKIL